MTLPLLYLHPSAAALIERNARNARAAEIRRELGLRDTLIRWTMDRTARGGARGGQKLPVVCGDGRQFACARDAAVGVGGNRHTIANAARYGYRAYGMTWGYAGGGAA